MLAQVFFFIALSVLLAAARQEGPDDCLHNKQFFPIYSSWASTVENECAEYTCNDGQQLTKKVCDVVTKPKPIPGKSCYPVGVSYNYYPYCCDRYVCVDNKSDDGDGGDS